MVREFIPWRAKEVESDCFFRFYMQQRVLPNAMHRYVYVSTNLSTSMYCTTVYSLNVCCQGLTERHLFLDHKLLTMLLCNDILDLYCDLGWDISFVAKCI